MWKVGRTFEFNQGILHEVKQPGVFKLLMLAEVRYRQSQLAHMFVSLHCKSPINFIHRLISNVGLTAIYLTHRRIVYGSLVEARRACGDISNQPEEFQKCLTKS